MKTPLTSESVKRTPRLGEPKRRDREKTRENLLTAMLRVKNKGAKMSISAVAEEAGVTPGLIHNTYPDVAEEIRARMGRTTRQQRDEKAAELVKARKDLRTLREELARANADIARLASINETLLDEAARLMAQIRGKVASLDEFRYR